MHYFLANGEELIIREPETSDAAALLAYFQQAVQDSDFLMTTPDEARQHTLRSEQDLIRSFRAHPHNLYLLALVGQQIVGTLSVTQGNRSKIEHTAEFGIAVIRPYWNMGIGRRLMTHMFRWLAHHPQIKLLYCKVMANNERAIHLYQSFGLEEEGRLSRFLRQPSGEYVDLIYFTKWLDEQIIP
ncbi:RimJ/RimL family protein N-acetyltransferase [Thermoflavifilum aggregans]|uniref:RimJ/RimL family protein N-acetyltransferase n=1 Tax=Thermoflavifilum aggregans TaxID=454188 RepID=A0A2M9CSU9_9BACT|nr:GNAT family protein [Thermoflavifilum aggregans]MBX6380640.1 GNAT family N-acetyltransferase [Thermoflavifilum aggregans]PJJ74973.1 RimJ/RimL family protein N-acetyltransferase [Thermoflavifilum aggregans]